jgi:hypothetical protein
VENQQTARVHTQTVQLFSPGDKRVTAVTVVGSNNGKNPPQLSGESSSVEIDAPMKPRISFKLAACAATALCLVGCRQNADRAGDTSDAPAQATQMPAIGKSPEDEVMVCFTDGHTVRLPADSVSKVVYVSVPGQKRMDSPAPAREHTLIEVKAEKSGQLVTPSDEQGFRIDATVIAAPQWQEMIRRAKERPSIRSGQGQMTLMRVVLEEAGPNSVIQLTSTKLVKPKEGWGAGGLSRAIQSGDFIVVEHINSARRREGKDPVEIGTSTHYRPTLWVEVPPRGSLGVLGDVIVSRFPKEMMGRIVARIEPETKDRLDIRRFLFGPAFAGGPYGEAVPFSSDHVCDTDLITPGSYMIVLPDFDRVKSLWTVSVSPGNVTHVRFQARSQQDVTKVEESVVPLVAK